MKKNKTQFLCALVATILLIISEIQAGQTGKITGKISDAATGETLPGANVIVEGTTIGAAADPDGDFIILNIPPGTYIVSASMMGFQDTRVSNVKVAVDRTTHVDFQLKTSVLEGEAVEIVAKQPLIQKDLTATAASVSASEIEMMPVESFQDVLQLQAGIVKDSQGALHIRGGRSSEIAFMIDGVSVSDPFSGNVAVEVDQQNIQELKVISGTFNAEYGQVMSGIVEIVTKDPEDKFKMGGSFYLGDYVSSHDDLFMNIDDLNPTAINNSQFYISGPVPGLSGKLSYFLSLRRADTDGWLYGIRKFMPSDSSNFQNPEAIYSEASGDNAWVAMNPQTQNFANAKLVLKVLPGLKASYSFIGEQRKSRYYNHDYKYNPDGDVTNRQYGFTHILNINHALSSRTFYTLKLSRYNFNYKSYLFEDADDPGYVNPELLRNREDAYSFLTGGTNMTHYYRETIVTGAKFDLTSQVTKLHQIKTGLEFKQNILKLESFSANYQGEANGGIFDASSYFNEGEYENNPVEAVAYIQDKVELQNMTLNIGLRYDYFNSRGKVPVDLRDPANKLREQENGYQDAEAKHQLSPRLGIAFPISAAGVIHISYGHFFQIPPYEYLYMNPRFAVAPGGLNTLMGNSDLKPQTTIIYEVGFQQEFFGQIGMDITGFYKDARDLLGVDIYETYVLGDRYARYTNRDYGNIKGVTLAVNKRPTPVDNLTVSFDYTFQIAEGNASDPNHEFYNNQADPPQKSNIQVVPLDWDQHHTVNLSVVFNPPGLFGIGLIGQFQSGLPYTPAIQSLETSFENSGRKPFNFNLDLRLFKSFKIGRLEYNLFAKIYNLLDRKNERQVYDDTGRAGYSLVSQYVTERSANVNTLDEWLKRPDYYSEPRKIMVGFDVEL